MRRDIIFLKSVSLANALLRTGVCKNERGWLFTCEDDEETMKALQKACSEHLKNTTHRNYKLIFANSNDYSDFKKY